MKLSELKNIVATLEELHFQLPNGDLVPSHYHVTEVGYVTKNFIDCGGTVREEKVANLQLWFADDVSHRLQPQKLLNILTLSEKKLGISLDFEIEVEYQSDTIGKYGLDFNGENMVLTSKKTACLALEACAIPIKKVVEKESSFMELASSDSGCCSSGKCC
ncbi:MAG: DUF6428 family protein [Chitinophagales bacterium]